MHTAVMEYHFKKDNFEEALELWKNEVMTLAKEQPGFVRMQLLTRDGEYALAIGTWESPEYAQRFMKTGIFKTLLERLDSMLVSRPNPVIWQTRYYVD